MLWLLSISPHIKDQKRCLHWDASHLIVICLFSLWRWGPHHSPSWTRTLFNLARCQMKLAYMFGLLSETSKNHLFWRSLRLRSLRYRTGLCICTCLPPCGWGFAKLRWTKSSAIVRDDCKFVPWRHLDLTLSVQLFNRISNLIILTIWLRIWNKKEWGFKFVWFCLLTLWSAKLFWITIKHQCVILLSSPIRSLWLYPFLCPASAVRCIWSMKATHHCDV